MPQSCGVTGISCIEVMPVALLYGETNAAKITGRQTERQTKPQLLIPEDFCWPANSFPLPACSNNARLWQPYCCWSLAIGAAAPNQYPTLLSCAGSSASYLQVASTGQRAGHWLSVPAWPQGSLLPNAEMQEGPDTRKSWCWFVLDVVSVGQMHQRGTGGGCKQTRPEKAEQEEPNCGKGVHVCATQHVSSEVRQQYSNRDYSSTQVHRTTASAFVYMQEKGMSAWSHTLSEKKDPLCSIVITQ